MPHLGDIVDLTPWAIAVYPLTPIGATFDGSWNRLNKNAASGNSHKTAPATYPGIPIDRRNRGIVTWVSAPKPAATML